MELQQILKLIDAGYTKEEIEAMQHPASQSEQAEEQQADETPASQSEQAEEQQAEETPATNVNANFDDMFKSLNDSIKEFDAKIKSLNTNFAEIKNADNMKLSDSDIIAKIIKPNKEG